MPLRLPGGTPLIGSGRKVTVASYAVGYESGSQFSREYARTFGVAPSRDAAVSHRPG